jgi:hypothetical protein
LALWGNGDTFFDGASQGVRTALLPYINPAAIGRLCRTLLQYLSTQRRQLTSTVLGSCKLSNCKDVINIVVEYALNVPYRMVQRFFCELLFGNFLDAPFAFQRRMCRWHMGDAVPGSFWLPEIEDVSQIRRNRNDIVL